MEFSQILLYVFIALIAFYITNKIIQYRAVKHYSASEVYEIIKKDRNKLLLDVRTPTERKADQIKGSLHIPLYDLKKRVSELNKFKDKEIICYCRTGNRSLTAASILKKNGFSSANLKGGMIRWNLLRK
jgi:rhodanese-related sulfurtransferase